MARLALPVIKNLKDLHPAFCPANVKLLMMNGRAYTRNYHIQNPYA